MEKKGHDETPSIVMTPDAIVKHMGRLPDAGRLLPPALGIHGCFHRAGMFDPNTGTFLRLAEDIGGTTASTGSRAGPASTASIRRKPCCSSRPASHPASTPRARRAGFSFLISRSAVTSTPVEMARQQNRLHPAHPVTVVGFCRPREERLTVFAGEGRIA